MGVLLLGACGGSGSSGDQTPESGGGTVTDEWRDFCVATFTEDHIIYDSFGDPRFTMRSGDEYLLAGRGFGSTGAELILLAPSGPYTFDVAADDAGNFPFETPCDLDGGTSYYAAFTDVTVYAEEELVTKLCDIEAGTALPRDTSSLAGFSSTGWPSGSEAAIYEVYLNVFGAQCGDATRGFISVSPARVLGSHTWLVPIQTLLGPS